MGACFQMLRFVKFLVLMKLKTLVLNSCLNKRFNKLCLGTL